MSTKSSYEPVESGTHDTPPEVARSRATPKHTFTSKSVFSLDDNWILEIVCIFLGVLLIIALCLVLWHYDGKEAPQFGDAFGTSLTLNTVVSIIVTGARVSLLLPAAECVGQLKWTWLAKKYRPLNDVSIFDKASRGIFGGFGLLWRTKLRSFATLGLFIMLIQLAIEPFTQQLIRFRFQEFPVAGIKATIGVAQNWNEPTLYEPGGWVASPSGPNIVSNRVKNAIQMGVNSANLSLSDIAPLCSGGNCTFDPYWSLAVCTRVANVTDKLTKSESNDRGNIIDVYRLTESHYLETHGSQYTRLMNMTSATGPVVDTKNPDPTVSSLRSIKFSESVAFRDANNPIADIFIIVSGHDDVNASAYEFVLEWCVQNFTTTVVNGLATTQRHNAFRNSEGGDLSFLTLKPFGSDENSETYEVEGNFHTRLQSYMYILFDGTITLATSGNPSGTSDFVQFLYEPFDARAPSSGLSRDLAHGLQGTQKDGLELMINNVATGLTNYVRSTSWATNYAAPVQGVVNEQVSIVVVRWKWITGHIIFAVLSITFLAVTLLHQHFSPIDAKPWKSSSAAVLHALDPALQQELRSILSQSAMFSQDGAVQVRLLPADDGGWRLVTKANEGVPLNSP